MSQNKRIIKYMNDFGSITAYEAIKDLGVMRLASRISDLRRKGYVIKKVTEKGVNRYGEPARWARYSLVSQEEIEEGFNE